MLPFPKKRLCFVDDGGGGGVCSCAAVGARDWRMEYVRCIVEDWEDAGICGGDFGWREWRFWQTDAMGVEIG